MDKIQKTPAGLDCSVVLSEESIAVGDDNVGITPMMADKDILKVTQSSKNIIDADSNDTNEMNIAALVPTSSEMRNVVKSMRVT
ncbi:hypothetical protein TNCV_2816611 [Trichonephila clavipes]|nr:hypothetical protein TNCV_2816611 [Trichonephila clavipes]